MSVASDVEAYLNSDGPGEPRDGSQIGPPPSENVTGVTLTQGRIKFKSQIGHLRGAEGDVW